MAPLAGRPPFATDEPDSVYESSSSPKRRPAPPKPDDPNKRSSAYDVYENYLAPGGNQANQSHLRNPSAVSTATSRNSGIGALGAGLLAMDSDDDDSDDDEAYERRRKAEREQAKREQEAKSAAAPQSKNAALAAAIANPRKNGSSSPTDMAIAAPRPGYAAQVSTISNNLDKASPVENPFEPQESQQPAPPHLRNPPGLPPTAMRGPPPPALNMDFARPGPPPGANLVPPPSPGGIMRGMTPAPLAAPLTPIKPVFAVPKTPSSPFEGGKDESSGVKWDDLPAPTPRRPVMRGDNEDTGVLPPRGQKGDDFWRRFSMIAKVEKTQKESIWLRKTTSGASRMSKWVWVVGMILLIAIAGSIGLGVYLTKDNPDHQEPATLGGQTTKPGVALSTTADAPAGTGTARSSSTILRVVPTHTIADRDFIWEKPAATAVAKKRAVREHLHSKRDRKSRF